MSLQLSGGEEQLKLLASALKQVERKDRELIFDPNVPGSLPTSAQWEIISDFGKIRTQWIVASNRCLAKGTLVHTPEGPRPIESIRAGDYVYSEYGQPIRVLETFENGIKEVIALDNRNKVYAEATSNHVWLAHKRGHHYEDLGQAEVSTAELSKYTSVVRTFPKAPLGNVNIPRAYALGALLGDGCSREISRRSVYISSANEELVAKVAMGQGYSSNHESNYTWKLEYTKDFVPLYKEWCFGRYAHEKIVDLDTVKSWDRQSILQLVAGIFDTDGSLHPGPSNVRWSVGMQAESVVNFIEYALLALWNIQSNRNLDNRTKYKNGPLHIVAVTDPHDIKRMMQELGPEITSPQKQWRSSYDELGKRSKSDRVTLRRGKCRLVETYDIHVDSPTNLYVLANGLVTHNSGKSQTCARLIAWALTDTHPLWDVPQPWLDEGMLILVAGRSSKIMEESLWPKIRSYLEPGSYKEVRVGNILQKVEYGKHRIIFQSMENPKTARERIQSYDAHMAWADEMIDYASLLNEIRLRVLTKQGIFLSSFTPLNPSPEVRKLVDGAALPHAKRYNLLTLENPVFLGEEARSQLLSTFVGMSTTEIATRLRGEWAISDDRVYSVNVDTMVEAPENYSPLWRHIESVDPALSSALGYTLWAENPATAIWYCIAAKYVRGILVPTDLVTYVQNLSKGVNIVKRISDPHEVWYIETARSMGIKYLGVSKKNDRKPELIKQLQQKLGNQVRLFPELAELLLQELQDQRYSDTGIGKIVNASSYHLIDSAQYFCDNIPKPETTPVLMDWDTRLLHEHTENKRKAYEAREKIERKAEKRQMQLIQRVRSRWKNR